MQSISKRTEEMKRSNRTIRAGVMISPEEQKAFFALAEKRGTDFSELVRQLLYRELKAEKKGEAA
jgi:hypothetical protein